MKAAALIFGILIALFTLSFFTSWYINHSTASITQQLQDMDNSIREGKWIEVHQSMSVAEEEWERIRGRWAMIIDHRDMENINLGFSRLKEYIDEPDPTQALAEISMLKLLFEYTSENQAFSLKNIL